MNALTALFTNFTGLPAGYVARSVEGDLRVEFVDINTYHQTGIVHFIDFDIAFLWDDIEKLERIVDVTRSGITALDPKSTKVATDQLLEAIRTGDVIINDVLVQKLVSYRDTRTEEQRKRFLKNLGVSDLPLSSFAE